MLDFQASVLDRSEEIPVVVDFWAPWCGPCRVLGPVIESMAQEAAGQWELVKVNTQDHPDIGRRFNIMSIPAVKMFHKGNIIAEFNGALPKAQISKWLDTYLPSEAKMAWEQIILAEELASEEEKIRMYTGYLAQYPGQTEAMIKLAGLKLTSAPDEVSAMMAAHSFGPKWMDQVTDIQTLLTLLQTDFPDSPLGNTLNNAKQAYVSGEMEDTILSLIEAVQIDKNYLDDLPRKACIAFFRTILGQQHPLTRKLRIKFSMALY